MRKTIHKINKNISSEMDWNGRKDDKSSSLDSLRLNSTYKVLDLHLFYAE